MTLTEVMGCGRQRGHIEFHHENEHTAESVPKVKIDLIVADSLVEKAVNAIIHSAKTGKIGDGKVFVSTIDEVIRIRTGEKGGARATTIGPASI